MGPVSRRGQEPGNRDDGRGRTQVSEDDHQEHDQQPARTKDGAEERIRPGPSLAMFTCRSLHVTTHAAPSLSPQAPG